MPRFRPTLSVKLFVAVLATAVLVVAAMVAAAQLSFTGGFVGYLNEQAISRMREVLPRAEAAYRAHGSWDFLRGSPGEWFPLVMPMRRPELEAGPPAHPAPPISDLTGAVLRLALLDADGHGIAGYPDPGADALKLPIMVDGRRVGWLAMAPFLSVSAAGGERFRDAQLRASIAMGAVALVLAAGIALWFGRILLAPLRRVAAATHRLAAGAYATRVQVDSNDEVGQLAADFNQLAQALERNERMRRDFIADISHELRTPLGVLHGELEAVEDGVRAFGPATLASLQAEVATLNKLVSDLYDLSLSDVGALTYRKADIDVAELLQSTVDRLRERFASHGLALESDLPHKPAIVFGDERRLQQLFDNLCENSLRYTDAGGRLRITLRAADQRATIDFCDTAPGVAPEALPRLFERFFRVDASRNRAHGGAGLGLAICRNIVEAHEGRVEAFASPLGGLRLAVTLPLAA